MLTPSSIAGTGQAAGGPARLHRPAQHPGEQVLQHDAEQRRGGEAVEEEEKIDQPSVIDIVPQPHHFYKVTSVLWD